MSVIYELSDEICVYVPLVFQFCSWLKSDLRMTTKDVLYQFYISKSHLQKSTYSFNTCIRFKCVIRLKACIIQDIL